MSHPYIVSFLFIPSLYPSLFNSKNFLFSSLYIQGTGRKVYSHSPGPRKSAGMRGYANACHCDNCSHICGISCVESLRAPRSKNAHGKGHIPPAVSGISILCLWDIQLTFDW